MKKFSLKRLFDNNRFVIVFSVVAALILYALVSIVTNDNRTSVIQNVPVTLDLTGANFTNQRLSLVDNNVQFYTDIEVYGPLNVIDDLTAESLQLATTAAGLNGITEAGPVTLQLTSAYDGDGALPFRIDGYSPANIELTFDRQATKEFPVGQAVNGLKTSPPFVFDNQYTSPETVRVTGPENALARVASVEVELELTEPLNAIYTDDLPVVLRDVQGNPIDPAQNHLTVSAATVQLVINVLTQTELPLKVEFLTPPRGFPVDKLREYMALSNTSLAVAGPQSVIDTITEIVVAYIDLKNLRVNDNSYTYPIDLGDENLKNLENIRSVKVSFDALDWTSALFHIDDVQIVSPPAGYEVELLTSRIENVEFIGLQETIDTLTADDIVAEINLAERELTPGQNTFPVKISAPGKGMVWAVGDYSVMIEVREIANGD